MSQKEQQRKVYFPIFSAVSLIVSFLHRLRVLVQEAEIEKESKHSSQTNLLLFFGNKGRLVFLALHFSLCSRNLAAQNCLPKQMHNLGRCFTTAFVRVVKCCVNFEIRELG